MTEVGGFCRASAPWEIAFAVDAPLGFVFALLTQQGAGDDEQQVGEPVEVDAAGRVEGRLTVEMDQPPFGAAADGAGQMGGRGAAVATGQHEVAQRRQGVVQHALGLFEHGDIFAL